MLLRGYFPRELSYYFPSVEGRTLKLSKKHYKTAYVLAHMLGYESLDDYVRYVVKMDVESKIKQGEIDLDVVKLS